MDKLVKEKKCYWCEHWHEKKPRKVSGLVVEMLSECRRDPPVIVADHDGDPFSYWPRVEMADSCGRWKDKDE